MNAQGSLTVEQEAQTAVQVANMSDEGHTMGFFHMKETLAW